MKLIITLLSFMLIISGTQIYGQILELKFTAVNNNTWIPGDSIKIINKTLDCDTILYYPDTILNLNYVGVEEVHEDISSFCLRNIFPNPVIYEALLELEINKLEETEILIFNSSGRIVYHWKSILERGIHHFNLIPGNEGIYFITIQNRFKKKTISLVNANTNRNKRFTLTYSGKENSGITLKSNIQKSIFSFEYGDTLMIINYSNDLESASLIAPESSQLVSFQFASNIPCPGIPTITYEGQVYNTIQIYNQCWLKENLNVGTMIPATQGMSNDGIIEKYCYNDSEDSCHIYGGLYQWDEMMEYYTYLDNQGICPENWHVPTNEEWKILEGAVDSQYGIGNPEWNITAWRGFDAGENLKSTSGWIEDGNGTNLYGFTALPAGVRDYYGYVTNHGKLALFWTSSGTNNIDAWFRMLRYEFDNICNTDLLKERGHSVRCLKND